MTSTERANRIAMRLMFIMAKGDGVSLKEAIRSFVGSPLARACGDSLTVGDVFFVASQIYNPAINRTVNDLIDFAESEGSE